MVKDMEKRRHERVELHGHIADVADGNFIYGGIIEDISMGGLKLNSLPTKFAVEGRTYSLVVSGGTSDIHIKLTVRPRWKKVDKSGLNRLARALSSLSLDDVLDPSDDSVSRELKQSDTLEYHLFNGMI